ncbi:MAG: C-GCAxxG-C-C family protein [Thermodesulfobacteriota bacterium]
MAVGQEKLNRNDPEVIKAMGAFGGGIASSGSVCGILIGGVAVVSSLHSRGSLDEKENPAMWALSQKLIRIFKKMTDSYDSMNCCDIAQVNWSNRDEVKAYYHDPDSRRAICTRLVGDFCYALGQLLEKDKKRQQRK